MNTENKNSGEGFSEKIGAEENRKLQNRNTTHKSVWSGFGLFGMVGWSVVVPTLLGVSLGIWLDKKYPQSFSWALSLLVAGLFIGCYLAWIWITKENKEMHKKNTHDE